MGTKISALPAGSAIAAANVLPVVQSGVTNKITVTQMFALPSATVISWNADTGFSRISTGVIGAGNGSAGDSSGTLAATTHRIGNGIGGIWVSTSLALPSNSVLSFSSTTNATATNDAFFGRRAAASFRFGAADAAAPVAQVLTVQNVVAPTADTAGVPTTIIGSLSTGSGTSGDIILQTGGTGAGSTSQNAAATSLTIKGATQTVLVASGKKLQLGNAATTGLSAGVLAALTNATLVLTDSAGQDYRIPCII